MTKTGILNEVFDSIQGEGLLLGYRQLFLRFAGCNLNCRFCDTPISPRAEGFKVYPVAGNDSGYYHQNPVNVPQLLAVMEKFDIDNYHSLTVTGGEPLLQDAFLSELLPALRSLGWKIHLQTNGICVDELVRVIDHLDWISMDYKLASVTGLIDFCQQHRKFFKICPEKVLGVKMVVSREAQTEEIMAGAKELLGISPDLTLILQPVTPLKGVKAPQAQQLFNWHSQLIKLGVKRLRIIPQIHPVLNLL